MLSVQNVPRSRVKKLLLIEIPHNDSFFCLLKCDMTLRRSYCSARSLSCLNARHLSRERENCQNQRILIEIQARECSYVRLPFRLCTINILRIFVNPLKLVPSLEKRRLTRTKLLTFASMITVWLHKCLLGKGTWVEQHLSMDSEPGDWIGLDYSQCQQYPIVIKKIYWYLKEKKIPLSNDNIDV